MRRSSSEAPVAQLEPARRWLEPLVAVSDPGLVELWSSPARGYYHNHTRN